MSGTPTEPAPGTRPTPWGRQDSDGREQIVATLLRAGDKLHREAVAFTVERMDPVRRQQLAKTLEDVAQDPAAHGLELDAAGRQELMKLTGLVLEAIESGASSLVPEDGGNDE